MLEKHAKFKDYWESIGKPKLEMLTISEKWENVNFNLDFSGKDYRIKDDPHWELRREWVDSDFTLPIELSYKDNDTWTLILTNKPSWDKNFKYRKAQPAGINTMTEQNPHAALIAEYCEDWKVTNEPWKDWQWLGVAEKWTDCKCHPEWVHNIKYRRKPKTININGFDVPMPISVKPQNGDTYYIPDVANAELFIKYSWHEESADYRFLDRNICHLDAESAIIHARALLSFANKGE